MRLTDCGSEVQLAYLGWAWTSGSVRANEILIGGEQVVGIRQPAIADAIGGSVVDSQVRAVVGEILGALRAHGLIAN